MKESGRRIKNRKTRETAGIDVTERMTKVGHKKGDTNENKTVKVLRKRTKDRKPGKRPERDVTERVMEVAEYKKGDA